MSLIRYEMTTAVFLVIVNYESLLTCEAFGNW